MIELDTIGLSYQPEKVVYKGKKFSAPVDISVLMSWDYMIHLLKTGEYKK
jgi:hypothetical protein